MVRLNEALRNSPALARQIRHHYPVALIDESQDINGLQVELIELVYLNEIANYHKILSAMSKSVARSQNCHGIFIVSWRS